MQSNRHLNVCKYINIAFVLCPKYCRRKRRIGWTSYKQGITWLRNVQDEWNVQLKSELCQRKGCDYGLDNFCLWRHFHTLSDTKNYSCPLWQVLSCGKCSNSTFCSFHWGSHSSLGWQLFLSDQSTQQIKWKQTKGSCNQKLLLMICVEFTICINIFFPPYMHDSVGASLWCFPRLSFLKEREFEMQEKKKVF